ncbi:MAG TPA: hypothetical protein VFV38_29800 [Ktedonobacteraceae bacterium]|nr:hypothetical protein [Ktedonobacteraceae bacterium]
MGDEWQYKPGYNAQNPQNPPEPEIPQDTQEPLTPSEVQDAWEPAQTEVPPEKQEPLRPQGEPESQLFTQENIDKRIEDIKRLVIQGASEATRRFSRVAERANEYWQQANSSLEPRRSSNMEEERIRQLANMWSSGNWQIARELGNYMEIVSSHQDEAWEIGLQTRWETRSVETTAEPYTGRSPGQMRPVLPIWDYELPEVTGLKAPDTRVRLEGNDEILSCTACNSTGHLLCATCSGKGWILCPDCKGRTRTRCETCRGRGYVADWADQKKKPFFRRSSERLADSVNEKISNMFDGIRQQGVPLPNPLDTDPANKGRTVPCPDCVNGEVECTCGTGKRICESCHGSKTELCDKCGGTGKIVRHRDLVRHFEMSAQTQIVGNGVIPEARLQQVTGDLVYNAEITEMLYPEAPPEAVPIDVWRAAVQLVEKADKPEEDRKRPNTLKSESRPSLQVLELVRIPYTRVDYRYNGQDYTFYVYDVENKEKFYAERFPARWDRIERLVKSITADLTTPVQTAPPANPMSNQARGYRVPIEHTPYVPPSYTVTEEEDEGL